MDLEHEGVLFKILKIKDKRILKVRIVVPHDKIEVITENE